MQVSVISDYLIIFFILNIICYYIVFLSYCDVFLYLAILLYFFQSVSFKKTSRNLARSMWWKNIKLTIIIVIVCIVSTSFHISYTKVPKRGLLCQSGQHHEDIFTEVKTPDLNRNSIVNTINPNEYSEFLNDA